MYMKFMGGIYHASKIWSELNIIVNWNDMYISYVPYAWHSYRKTKVDGIFIEQSPLNEWYNWFFFKGTQY